MISYPITYGDTISEDEDNKRFQSHCISVVGAILFLELNVSSASASDVPGAGIFKG